MSYMTSGRSLRGNVDRNIVSIIRCFIGLKVVPYVGTWIEIRTADTKDSANDVVPYVGTWIEI